MIFLSSYPRSIIKTVPYTSIKIGYSEYKLVLVYGVYLCLMPDVSDCFDHMQSHFNAAVGVICPCSW